MRRRAILGVLVLAGALALVGVEVAVILPRWGVVPLLVAIGLTMLPVIVFAVAPLFGKRWTDTVRASGTPARAVLIDDPRAYAQGVSYEGADIWVDFAARIEPDDAPPYDARMTCRLSEAVFGLMEKGSVVRVRFDPARRERVLLVDTVQELQQRRVKV